MVRSEELPPEKRVAILSERGLLLFQQRYIHHLTRAVVSLETLEQASAHVLAEVELQEDWNRDLVTSRMEAGEELREALVAEGASFDEFLKRESVGKALRDQLRDPARRTDVRRRVRQEIARRRNPLGA